MNRNTTIEIGEKLKQIRKAKELSQDNIAYAIDKHTSVISRIESGQVTPTPEVLDSIRKFLEIENAPLLPHEIDLYQEQYQIWEALLDANRVDAARAMQPELAIILSLPYEHDMILGFLMSEARLLFKEIDFAAVEERLSMAEPLLPYASNESLILYYSNKAQIFNFKRDIKSALKYHLISLELFGDNKPYARILMQVAHCCLMLGKYHHAIRYILHARVLYEGDRTNPVGYYFNDLLAQSYFAVGELKKAEDLFDISYKQAKLNNNKINQGGTLAGIAGINAQKGNYDAALKQYDTALQLIQEVMHEIIPNEKHLYIFPIFNKAILQAKLNIDNNETIAQGRSVAEGDELYTVLLDAAYHIGNLSDTASENYLEDIAIPYMQQCDGQERLLLLTLCEELEAHYKKKKTKTKANNIATIVRTIYKNMFIWDME